MCKNIILVLGMCLILVGCNKTQEPENEIGYGEFSEGVYTNSYFNMSIDVPENWAVQSQAAQKELLELGGDLLSGDDQNLKNALSVAQQRIVNMFAFFKFEAGAPVEFNPNIIMIAEKVSDFPGVKTGNDYLFHTKQQLEAGQIGYEFPNEIYSKDISGVLFHVMPMQTTVGKAIIYQEYYAAKINDYALTFVLSYSTDIEQDELNTIVGTLKFSR